MPTVTPKESHDMILANRLTIFRKQYIDKSQNQASKKLGMAQSALSYMESGKMPIRFEFIAKLEKEYHLNQEWFSTGTGKPTDKNPKKVGLLVDINLINEELASLKNYIKKMELNQNYMLKVIGDLKDKIDGMEKKNGTH